MKIAIFMRCYFSVLLFSLLLSLSANAKPISREQAQQKATAFLLQQKDNRTLVPVVSAHRLAPRRAQLNTSWTQAPYYVFDRGTNEGFVIVSGDDQTIDVLGYCDEGSFNYDQLPPNMKEWLDDYEQQLLRVQAGAPVVTARANHAPVAAMVKSKWSQGNPYNLSCPYDKDNKRSVTGCVATAMAQLLYHNRDKMVTEVQADIPGYNTYTQGFRVEGIKKGAAIDWENMKDTYGSANDLQKKAVADLMHYCGVGAKMDYTSSSSGAQSWDAYQAFLKYFGFSGSKVKWYDYSNVSSDSEWDRIIYTEMAEGRPIYISGSNNSAGHAFVCDGCDGTRYHINWGWGGQSDGYYYLTNLTPGDGQGIGGSDAGYNGYRQIFVGIEPENFGAKAVAFSDATVKSICEENWDEDKDGTFTYAEAAAVTDLGSAFKGKAIKTFAELYYFTGLTAIGSDAFNGCTSLTTLRMPKSVKSIGARSFKDCETLTQCDIPTGVKTIGEEAFAGCKTLAAIELPVELTAVEKGTFQNCERLTSMSVPVCVEKLGDEAFAGCSRLKSFTLNTFHPENITMGTNIFGTLDLSGATLNVLQGLKSYFAAADQWKNFGTIFEMRERSEGNFAKIEAGVSYYFYHVGTGKYLTKGEAWGSQAIVGEEPMLFKVNHSTTMPEGQYYLTTVDLGDSYVFRTANDKNLGIGVQGAFVDGGPNTTIANTYWNVQEVSDKVYTFQIPANGTNYAEGNYWGVQTDHKSGAATPTYGVYSDVVYADHKFNCQWQLVRYDEAQEAKYEAAVTLLNLISMAQGQNKDYTAEQAVYDNLNSTIDELKAAQRTLRKKLKLIDFVDPEMRTICISLFDSDRNGELSYVEASDVTDLTDAFNFQNNKTLTNANDLQYFVNATTLYGNTFYLCSNLETVILPAGLQRIYYQAFRNCSNLRSITIPEGVTTIGNNCFYYCTSLKEVTVENPDPSAISLGMTPFSGVTLKDCTLKVPAGSKALYEKAATWKDFGTIVEARTKTQPAFSKIVTDTDIYVYNKGTRRMITLGEAYGTQSVVGRTGRLYQLKRSSNMAEGVYYLYDVTSEEVVFRVSTDSKVGEGVKTCFGDGSLSAKAYWQIDSVGENLYTLHIPATHDDYVAGEYLGVDEDHKSSYASPTNGLYYDIKGVTSNSTWAFITKEALEAATETDAVAQDLKAMLTMAAQKGVDASDEQAVYDNLQSTKDELKEAARSLRDKMGLISFDDEVVKTLCINKWDSDNDYELSLTEAAAVTSIGETFRGSAIKYFDELRFFTSLTAIPENAFCDCSKLFNIYVPEGVKTIERYVFSNCSNLRYVALLNGAELIPATVNGMTNKVTLFVKGNLLESYQSDADWKSKGVSFSEYTGTPVVTAEATRQYAYTSAVINVLVQGAPINGEPEYSCDAIADGTKDAGEYPIEVTPGTITTHGLVCQEGVFTITQRKARITAKSYTRAVGQPNPVFEIDRISGLKNDDKAEEIFLVQPVFTCEATVDSPVGIYDIVPSGAEAKNYYFDYKNGTLTITEADSDGIETITADEAKSLVLYDLQGRRITSPKSGIYVKGKKKILVR